VLEVGGLEARQLDDDVGALLDDRRLRDAELVRPGLRIVSNVPLAERVSRAPSSTLLGVEAQTATTPLAASRFGDVEVVAVLAPGSSSSSLAWSAGVLKVKTMSSRPSRVTRRPVTPLSFVSLSSISEASLSTLPATALSTFTS